MSTSVVRVVKRHVASRLAAWCVLCSAIGCGIAENMEKAARNAAERDNLAPALQAFGKLYIDFHYANRRGPTDAKELEAFAAKSGRVPVLQSIRKAKGDGGRFNDAED